jgi:hypothetical protein
MGMKHSLTNSPSQTGGNKMKTAKELKAGNVIPPPAHERKWLKNPLTVLEVSDGHTDKSGQWLYVKCSFQSPYRPGPEGQSTMKINVRPDTQIKILQEVAQ